MPPLYDPLSCLGKYRWWGWAFLALIAAFFQGPLFLRQLPGNPETGGDFFQDWASVKLWQEGKSPYSHLSLAVEKYLGHQIRDKDGSELIVIYVQFNAHPPPSLFFAYPFSFLTFSTGMLAWNLALLALLGISLAVMARLLDIPVQPWGVFPLVAMALLCGPFRCQVGMGQWNFLLLFLLVMTWRAFRQKRSWEAGFWLGTAAAIKLIPGLLVLAWFFPMKWRNLAAFFLTALGWNLLAGICFGFDWLGDYYFRVLPLVRQFEGSASNISWTGFFAKLFYPEFPEKNPPLWDALVFGKSLALACQLTFLGFWLALPACKSSLKEEKHFLLGILAILLAGPITWDHYPVMALPVFLICWVELKNNLKLAPLFMLALFLTMVPMGDIQAFLKKPGMITPMTSPIYDVTLLSLPTYGLTLFFFLSLYPLWEKKAPTESPR